jgi:hypothetical protein
MCLPKGDIGFRKVVQFAVREVLHAMHHGGVRGGGGFDHVTRAGVE